MQVVCAAAAAVVILFHSRDAASLPTSNMLKLREWDLWMLCVSCGCCVCSKVAPLRLASMLPCQEATGWHILVAMEAVWRTYTMI